MGACPKGWHLPELWEWQYLVEFEAAETNYERWAKATGKALRNHDRADQAGKYLKAKTGWKTLNGEDKFGFAALPGGKGSNSTDAYGGKDKIEFTSAGDFGTWLTATVAKGTTVTPYEISMNDSNEKVRFSGYGVFRSVRCVQGASAEEALAAIEKVATAEKEAAEKVAVENATGKQFNPKINYGSMTDARDKATYKTVKIGTQTWMAENLNYDAKDSKCFNDKDYYCKRDGRLYDWATAKTACPAGWHLPTKDEWETLGKTAGGLPAAGKKLKSTNGGWVDRSDEKKPINGTDDFGFSALRPTNKQSFGRDFGCMWWSASEAKRAEYGHVSGIFSHKLDDPLSFDEEKKTYLFNVRCVQGEAPKEAPVAAQPAAQQPASPPKQEFCSITFPKKACVQMPGGTCKLSGGKVVDKCP